MISNENLCIVAERIAGHGADVALGGGVFKQRFARSGHGKSAGYRLVIVLRRTDRLVFVHGYAKSDQANLTDVELSAFRELSEILLGYSDMQFEVACNNGTLIELTNDD